VSDIPDERLGSLVLVVALIKPRERPVDAHVTRDCLLVLANCYLVMQVVNWAKSGSSHGMRNELTAS
jgi:hypothetical protein